MAKLGIKLNNSKNDNSDLGFCSRCGNYSSSLTKMGQCTFCDDEFEKNKKPDNQKRYIKVGKREHLGL